jgi:hypothetical protein
MSSMKPSGAIMKVPFDPLEFGTRNAQSMLSNIGRSSLLYQLLFLAVIAVAATRQPAAAEQRRWAQ